MGQSIETIQDVANYVYSTYHNTKENFKKTKGRDSLFRILCRQAFGLYAQKLGYHCGEKTFASLIVRTWEKMKAVKKDPEESSEKTSLPENVSHQGYRGQVHFAS